jgi:2-polyprenyl-6-methoxyphenol hydroxylase-like FAD-dependent oxidoreductase
MAQTDVLIAGAGPTGLALALWLTRLGVPFRIVDKAAHPGEHSRALAVQARTLEFYDQIGIAGPVVAEGLKFGAVNLWVKGERSGRVMVGDAGEGLSRYPYVLILPQDQHEQILTEQLRALGREVERPLELVGLEQQDSGVVARLRRPNGSEETCEAAYLAGCDGARSAVREALGVTFPGGTYDHTFYVADVAADGPVVNQELHIALDATEFLGVFPMKAKGTARLVGTVHRDPGPGEDALGWEGVSRSIMDRMKITVEKVNWFSTYRVHHRVAGRFREGRAFLLGDAAHIHSPVGGQGMNTGIGDAVNLAWKLASVLRAGASEKLLDTYEPERISFARRLVKTTDEVFTIATSPRGLARRLRTQVASWVAPAAWRSKGFRQFMYRTVSQIGVEYREGPLARGAAGRVAGGDRLPWAGAGSGPAGGDNFTPLISLDWQVHVYGEPSVELEEACQARGLPLRAFIWRPDLWREGLMEHAAYLVRPDGYVALADPKARPETLFQFLDAWDIKPRPPVPAIAEAPEPVPEPARKKKSRKPKAKSAEADEPRPGSSVH